MAEELYDVKGNKLSFNQILGFTHSLIAGDPSAFMKNVMPVAYDRHFKVPIYELLDKDKSPLLPDANFRAMYYPKRQSVIVNPEEVDRRKDQEGFKRSMRHEAYHHAVNVFPGLFDKVMTAIEASPKARDIYGRTASHLDVFSQYEKPDIPEETQAYLVSDTLQHRNEPAKITFKQKLFSPVPDYMSPEASRVIQEAMYPAFEGKAKKRFEYARPKAQQDVPEKGYLQSAIDSFMSIIGLGVK